MTLGPRTPHFRGTLAESLFRQGRREEAIQVVSEILAIQDTPVFRAQLQRFQTEEIPRVERR